MSFYSTMSLGLFLNILFCPKRIRAQRNLNECVRLDVAPKCHPLFPKFLTDLGASPRAVKKWGLSCLSKKRSWSQSLNTGVGDFFPLQSQRSHDYLRACWGSVLLLIGPANAMAMVTELTPNHPALTCCIPCWAAEAEFCCVQGKCNTLKNLTMSRKIEICKHVFVKVERIYW